MSLVRLDLVGDQDRLSAGCRGLFPSALIRVDLSEAVEDPTFEFLDVELPADGASVCSSTFTARSVSPSIA